MKNVSLKKAIALCVVCMLLLCAVLTGCAGRRTVTAEDFTAACDAAGFAMEDASSAYSPAVISAAWVCDTATCSMGYYNFTDAASAKAQYAQMFSTLSSNSTNAKHIDSAEYNRFYVSDQNGTALLYRNGSTLIYLASDDTETLSALIEKLGL